MKFKIFAVACLLVLVSLAMSLITLAQEQQAKSEHQPKKEKFAALAFMPSGAGPAMVGAGAKANVDIYVNSYTNDAEAKSLASVLREAGPDALLKALEKTKSKGRISLSGRVGFYDLKLIRSHRIEGGRRIYAVGDRPVGFLEAYVSNRSRDYPFGILQLDLQTNSKGKEEGSGALLYAAKIKVLDGSAIDVESYGIGPVKLMGLFKH